MSFDLIVENIKEFERLPFFDRAHFNIAVPKYLAENHLPLLGIALSVLFFSLGVIL